MALPAAWRAWYGEPPAEARQAYRARANALGLEEAARDAAEPLAERLWRRYGVEAMALVEAIRRDPRAAEVVLPGAGFLRCELELVAEREMVVRLEDFLRRRTSIALQVRREELRREPGLREVARILFGEAADARLAEYFGEGG